MADRIDRGRRWPRAWAAAAPWLLGGVFMLAYSVALAIASGRPS